MDLWIRTQDRTTLIRSYEIYIAEQCNMYVIRAKRTSHILGVYNTFERALKILDEIQNMLHSTVIKQTANALYFESKKIVVYEMPNE